MSRPTSRFTACCTSTLSLSSFGAPSVARRQSNRSLHQFDRVHRLMNKLSHHRMQVRQAVYLHFRRMGGHLPGWRHCRSGHVRSHPGCHQPGQQSHAGADVPSGEGTIRLAAYRNHIQAIMNLHPGFKPDSNKSSPPTWMMIATLRGGNANGANPKSLLACPIATIFRAGSDRMFPYLLN